MSAPILAAGAWATNAELIADCARLGYLTDDGLTLDPTYGLGKWWTVWRPRQLVAHDINPAKAPEGPADFTNLPYPDGHFDHATFDPPYMAPGGRKTSTIATFNDSFGLHTTPTSPAQNQELINAGLAEMARVVRPGGTVLVKVMDYISSGKLWLGTHYTLCAAIDLELHVVDRIEHVGQPGPQPTTNRDGTPRRQVHARRNLSTLLVFTKPRRRRAAAIELPDAPAPQGAP